MSTGPTGTTGSFKKMKRTNLKLSKKVIFTQLNVMKI